MKIEFETDSNGYNEARKFKSLLDTLLKHDEIDASLKSFAGSIEVQLDNFLSKPEFQDFIQTNTVDNYNSSYSESLGSGLNGLIRKFWGPSRREKELSSERQQWLERAEYAENSAFAALAETAEVGRQRDELKAQIRTLQDELEKYRQNG